MEYAVNQLSEISKAVNSLFPKTMDELQRWSGPTVNYILPKFIKNDRGYQLEIGMPGYKKEDIEVLLDPANFYLTVKIMDPCNDEERVALYHRTVSIPSEADISGGYTAKLDLGILTVTFPVDEDTQPRIIEVTVE
jgi:HSP20 family molecular chaperone IbpA